jgi:hypothetical protein
MVLVLLIAVSPSRAQPIPPLQSEKSSLDANGCFVFEATVKLGAPPSEVFDTLSHPEKFSAYISAFRMVRVLESEGGYAKILEWDGPPGRGEGPGGYYISARDEYLFNRTQLTVSVERIAKPPIITFTAKYELTPNFNRIGIDNRFFLAGTLIHYSSVQCREPDDPEIKDLPPQERQKKLEQEEARKLQTFLSGVNDYMRYAHRPQRQDTPSLMTPTPTVR